MDAHTLSGSDLFFLSDFGFDGVAPVLGGDEDDDTGEDRESGAKDHKETESKPVRMHWWSENALV